MLHSYREIIENAFKEYSAERDNISRGFIKSEHIKLVSDLLNLKELSDSELGKMFMYVDFFFDELYCLYDTDGKIIGVKPYNKDIAFYRDTQSAWLAVINAEEVHRRNNK